MYKSRRIVVRNENRSGRSVNSEQWTVSRGQKSVIINHWTLLINHWYWHEVFCVCRRGKVRELAQRSMWCNSPLLQIHPHFKSPMLQFTHIPNSPTFQIHPCFKFTHVFNCSHLEGLIAISPYTCVIKTFANIHVNTQKNIMGMVWVCLRTL